MNQQSPDLNELHRSDFPRDISHSDCFLPHCGIRILPEVPMEKVAILGASDKPDRFAYKAFKLLQQFGHQPIPVSPKTKMIDGKKVYSDLNQVPKPIDTLTMYVNASVSTQELEKIIKLKPRRIIFNPGSENPEIESQLQQAGINVVHACTLVMLNSNSF